MAAAPANDNFADAQVANMGDANPTQSNAEATKEVDEPNHAGSTGGASVWYRWTAATSSAWRRSIPARATLTWCSVCTPALP